MGSRSLLQSFSSQCPKIRVVVDAGPATFCIHSLAGSLRYSGSLSEAQYWDGDRQVSRAADWSLVEEPGIYQLTIELYAISEFYEVSETAWHTLGIALLRGFYFQRASIPLEQPYAAQHIRPAGHADIDIFVHPSAASPSRPAGSKMTAPKGWYDAGDFNKYIVNSAISVWTLLTLFRMEPQRLADLHCNIPESGGAFPDILAEARWNIDWMLCMQDPCDGGVYHKLTNLRFDPFRMPDLCNAERFVVQKTTAASLDFAACLAHAFRIYKPYDPEFAEQCLAQARLAYIWANNNPTVFYVQPDDIGTGRYEDEQLGDEFSWAACELFLSTGEDQLCRDAKRFDMDSCDVPNWQNVATLGQVSLALEKADPQACSRIIDLAEELLLRQTENSYHSCMRGRDYVWGSNAVIANQGMILLLAAKLGNDDLRFRTGAAHCMNYLLGTNPLQRSFITGFGVNPPRHPHHRISAADGIVEPVPGLLVGGANAGQHDRRSGVRYPTEIPALSYLDEQESYASNEIAINWNAPAAFLALGLASTLVFPEIQIAIDTSI